MPFIVLFSILFLSACVTPSLSPQLQRIKKGKTNGFTSLWLPFAPKRVQNVYTHSLVQSHRGASDCWPDCPKVAIWQYQYRPNKKKTLTSQKPIATQKAHWKVPNEARIIAISMFNSKRLYFDGFQDYLRSFKLIKTVNKIDQPRWGYETFTVRVYVAKRNPQKLGQLGPLKNETPDDMIEQFLDLGCEVAYVDNGLGNTDKDGTFWRFMVAAEEMPEGQRIRYLIRDADQILTAGEAFSIGEWIASGFQFHRMHLAPACFGPLTAQAWGGSHVGAGPFSDMKSMIEYYPYRIQYGDDELFSRDMIWPRQKASGSVMTHHYPRKLWFTFGNPYTNSCEEPTSDFCEAMRPGGHCLDVEMPPDILTPLGAIGLRAKLDDLKQNPEYFDLHGETPRGRAAIDALSAH